MVAALPYQRLIPVGALALASGALGVLAGIDPALALGAVLALAFMVVVLANLYAGLILFILLTFAAEIPGLVGSAFTVSKFIGLLLVISWLAALTIRGQAKADFPSAHPVATWILVAFLAWVGATQLWADEPATSLDALFRLSLNAILFLIIFTAVRTRNQALGVIAAFVAGACLDAAYGLLNPVDVANEARLAGSASKPGELAAALVAGLALSLGLATALRRMPLARLAVIAAAALCATGIFLTGSRGGLIALAVALAAFIVVGAQWRGRLLVLAVIVVVAGIGFFNYVATPDLRERVTTLGTGSGRVDLWTVGWRMVEENPVRGVGAGNFQTSSVDYVLEPGAIARGQYVIDDPKVAHNTYLEIWAETGVVGLALFLAIVGFCLRSALQAAREFARTSDRAMEMISRALFVAMAGFLAGAFFTSREYSKDVWLVLALGPALLGVARARIGPAGPEDGDSPPGPVVSPAAGTSRPPGARA